MPSPDTILTGLTALANEWRSLAIAWHIFLGTSILSVLAGWRPPARRLGQLLLAPLASVAVLAFLSGNPFNGILFVVLTLTLIRATTRFLDARAQLASPAWVAAGAAFIVFGWAYPHFLPTDSWTAYLYAAPFGILPCPTLTAVIGVTLAFRNLHSRPWSAPLAVAGLWYGTIGVFALGVALDFVLLLASAMLAVAAWRDAGALRSVRADRGERTRSLPGDDFIPAPFGSVTHAITIARGPEAVWPWLVQMGAGTRAGWYSYDALDNGRRPSASRLIAELQHIEVGTVFPAAPGVQDAFKVLAFEPVRSLVLGWTDPEGRPIVTWSFLLERRPGNETRLVVRVRGGQAYRFLRLPAFLSWPVIRVVHFVMQRKQLLSIAQRAENSKATVAALEPVGVTR